MRKTLIISIVLVFVVAPLGAWALVASKPRYSSTPAVDIQPATKGALLAVIKQAAGRDNGYVVQDIASYKLMDKWWYLVTTDVIYDESTPPVAIPALVSKFDNSPNSLKVVTLPGEHLPYYNISAGQGVPYDVIDELNKALGQQ